MMHVVFLSAALVEAGDFALPLVAEVAIHRHIERWRLLSLAMSEGVCMMLLQVLGIPISCHNREITSSAITTIAPILHLIQMIHQAMGQGKGHDQSHEREQIRFLQCHNTEEDIPIPIHQEVTTEGIGMMVLVGILVGSLTAQEGGLAETQILVFPRIAVT